MNIQSNLWKLYGIRFFNSLIPAYVIERLFWEQRGMTIQMVVYTEILYAITVVLFEVPSGIVADRWGRRKMIFLSAILESCMMLILIFATQFWHFAAAIFLSGVSRTANSGAENALLYDSLLLTNRKGDFEKSLGRLNAIDFGASIIAALCGSWLANAFGFELNYWISFVSILVSGGLALMLAEARVGQNKVESIPLKQYVRVSLGFFKNHRDVLLIVFSGMVLGASLNFIYEFWQIYLNRMEIPVMYFGVGSAILMLLRFPGNLMVPYIKNRFSYRTVLSAIVMVYTAGFLYLALVDHLSGLAVIGLICLVSGVVEPLTTGYLHHRIDSDMRATIDSFQSLGLNAVVAVTGLGFGYFSTRYDIFGGFGFLGVICGLFFLYFMIVKVDIKK